MALTRLGPAGVPLGVLSDRLLAPLTILGLMGVPQSVLGPLPKISTAVAVGDGILLSDTPSEVITVTFPDAGITLTDTVTEILRHPVLESIASGITATDGPPSTGNVYLSSLIDTVLELDQVYLPSD